MLLALFNISRPSLVLQCIAFSLVGCVPNKPPIFSMECRATYRCQMVAGGVVWVVLSVFELDGPRDDTHVFVPDDPMCGRTGGHWCSTLGQHGMGQQLVFKRGILGEI